MIRSLLSLALVGCLLVPVAAVAGAPQAIGDNAEATGKKKARSGTGIEWHIEPKRVEIYVDGKKIGTAGALTWTKHKPGRHTVRLVNGEDETEMDVGLKKGQTLTFKFVFDES